MKGWGGKGPPQAPDGVADSAAREPKGYAVRYALALFGLYFAILPPTFAGLSIKVQQLSGLGAAAQQLGLISGIGFMFALVSQPVAGRLSDRTTSRFGMRKPWIVLGAAGLAASIIGVGAAGHLLVLLLFWCLAQITHHVVHGALLATVADQVPEGRLGLVSSAGGAMMPIAMVVSAVSLKVLPTNEARMAVPALVGAGLCLLFAFALKDKTLARPDRAAPRKEKRRFHFEPKLYVDFGLVWLAKASIALGFSAITTYLTLFLAKSFDMSVDEQLQFNLYATVARVPLMILGAVGGGWISNRFGRRKLLFIAAGMSVGVGIGMLGAGPFFQRDVGLALVLVGEAILGVGFGLFLSVDAAISVNVIPDPANKARDLGVLSIATSLPGAVAPLIAGGFIIPFGDALAPDFGFSLWFFIAASVTIAGTQLALFTRRVR